MKLNLYWRISSCEFEKNLSSSAAEAGLGYQPVSLVMSEYRELLLGAASLAVFTDRAIASQRQSIYSAKDREPPKTHGQSF